MSDNLIRDPDLPSQGPFTVVDSVWPKAEKCIVDGDGLAVAHALRAIDAELICAVLNDHWDMAE